MSTESWEPQPQSQQRQQRRSLVEGFILGTLMMCLVLSVQRRNHNEERNNTPIHQNVRTETSNKWTPIKKSADKAKLSIPSDVYVVGQEKYDEPLFPQLRTKRGTGIMKPSLENYRPDMGLQTIPFRITDPETVQAHMRYYYGTNSTSPPPPTLIYFVTPTHKRVTQIADLIRLANTLDHDCAIYWIVVEDATGCSKRVRDILDRTGVEQRNVALDIIEYLGLEGVVYFGDDDNAYDVRMFPELRRTKRVGTFGVAYSGGGTYERCMVDPKTGKVSSFVTNWVSDRKYPVDMASLSFHTSVLLTEQRPRFSHEWDLGYLETKFLQLLISEMEEMEPLMSNCQRMFVFHVTTEYPYWKTRQVPISMEKQDNLHSKITASV
ncbi:glycosyltransferase [Fragilaria crotonensis]|nr:glycosyltransferase [Fragilaria crotonensis]